MVFFSFIITHIMNNIVKKSLYGSFATLALFEADMASAIDFGGSKVDSSLKGSDASADSAIQTLIGNAITFLYLVAVVFALWGGFNILTAGGDEEKVKKGKTILIQAAIGLVVIFLASSIVNWVVTKLLGTT